MTQPPRTRPDLDPRTRRLLRTAFALMAAALAWAIVGTVTGGWLHWASGTIGLILVITAYFVSRRA